jgi:hypothetical protein
MDARPASDARESGRGTGTRESGRGTGTRESGRGTGTREQPASDALESDNSQFSFHAGASPSATPQ